MTGPGERPALVRRIGAAGLAVTVVNMVVGIGIFGLPGLVAARLGSAAVLAYAGCAVLTTLIALCMAEAVSRVPEAGGIMGAAGAAFGPVGASVAGNLLWFSTGCLAISAVAVLALDTLTLFWPAMGGRPARVATLAALFAGLAWVNIRGVREGVRATALVSFFKFAPLLLLVVLGLPQIDVAQLQVTALPSAGDLSSGVVLLFFAFLGSESALSTSGEVVRPERNVPLGLGTGLLAVGLLYFALQTVGQGLLGPALAEETSAPLVAVGRALLGPTGATLIMLTTIASALGVLVADALATPRALFGLGSRGLLPRALGRVHPVSRVPHVAIAAYCTANFLLASSGTFNQLALFAAGGTLAMHLVTAGAVLRLRRDPAMAGLPGFRIPGGPLVPLLTLVLISAVLLTLRPLEIVALVALCLVAAIPGMLRAR